MQLTPLQLEIQQRSDKTLSFGCIVKIGDDIKRIVSVISTGPEEESGIQLLNKKYRDIPGELQTYDGDENMGMFLENYEIIGHPMTRGRLSYIHWTLRNRTKDQFNTFLMLVDYCTDNPELYQQTILERPEDFQLLVKAFLDTLLKEQWI